MFRTQADACPAVPRRNWKTFAIRICVSASILVALILLLPRDRLVDALGGFSGGVWLAGISVYLSLHLIGVAKWRMLINAAGGNLTFGQAARCYYYGLFGNTFLPSVVGGDIVRAGLAMRLSSAKSAVLMGSLLDRTIDSLGLALLAGMGALLISTALGETTRSIFYGIVILIVAAGMGMTIVARMLPARRFSFRIRRRLARMRVAIRKLANAPGKVLIALVSAMTLQACQVVMNLWLGRLALIQNATFLIWLFVWPLAKLAALVPLTQGGIGVREAAQGALFLPFGVSMEKAVATGLIFQTIVIGGNLFAGMLAALLGFLSRSARGDGRVRFPMPGWVHPGGRLGAFVFGGGLFFIANVLAIAHGSGSIGTEWVDWMTWIPGYRASFSGACAGSLYGAGLGYVLGSLAVHWRKLRRVAQH